MNQRFVPWAWGANGVASVIGAAVCILLSMAYGFNAVLAGGIAAYLGAASCMLTAGVAPATEYEHRVPPVASVAGLGAD